MAPSCRGPTVQKGADNIGECTEAVELLLPVGRDLVAAFFVQVGAVLETKGGVAEEGPEERHVVSLHNDCR